MKLRAARLLKDTDDIAVLLRVCDVRSAPEAAALLETYYGGEHEMSPDATMIVNATLGEHTISLADDTDWTLDPVQPRQQPTTCNRWVLQQDKRCGLAAGHPGQCA
jgi:hypothetical protein